MFGFVSISGRELVVLFGSKSIEILFAVLLLLDQSSLGGGVGLAREAAARRQEEAAQGGPVRTIPARFRGRA